MTELTYKTLVNLNASQLSPKLDELYESYQNKTITNPRILAFAALIGGGASVAVSSFLPFSFFARFTIGLTGATITPVALEFFRKMRMGSVSRAVIEQSMNSFLKGTKEEICRLQISKQEKKEDLKKLKTSLEDQKDVHNRFENQLNEYQNAPELLKLWQGYYSSLLGALNKLDRSQKLSPEEMEKLTNRNQCREIVEREFDSNDKNYTLLLQLEQLFTGHRDCTIKTFNDNPYPSFKKNDFSLNSCIFNLGGTAMFATAQHGTQTEQWWKETTANMEKFANENGLNQELFSHPKLTDALKCLKHTRPLYSAASDYKHSWVKRELEDAGSVQSRILNLSPKCGNLAKNGRTEIQLNMNQAKVKIDKIEKQIQRVESEITRIDSEISLNNQMVFTV